MILKVFIFNVLSDESLCFVGNKDSLYTIHQHSPKYNSFYNSKSNCSSRKINRIRLQFLNIYIFWTLAFPNIHPCILVAECAQLLKSLQNCL